MEQHYVTMAAGSVAGGFSVIILWVMTEVFGVKVPSEVANGLQTILTVAIAYVFKWQSAGVQAQLQAITQAVNKNGPGGK